jgi:hypothetical protein
MQCPSCGASLAEGTHSCPNCGRVFVSTPPSEAGAQPEAGQAASQDSQQRGAPLTPSQPVYAPPSQPLYGYPSQPLYGPPSQPYYGAPQSMPLAGAPPTIQLPRREPFNVRRFLIGGIPLWVGIIALGAIVVTFGIGVFALKKDWADSAWIAAFVALAGVGVILVAGIVILSLRRFQWLTLGISALLLVTMSVSGAFAMTNQPTVHRLQARAGEQPAVAGRTS